MRYHTHKMYGKKGKMSYSSHPVKQKHTHPKSKMYHRYAMKKK